MRSVIHNRGLKPPYYCLEGCRAYLPANFTPGRLSNLAANSFWQRYSQWLGWPLSKDISLGKRSGKSLPPLRFIFNKLQGKSLPAKHRKALQKDRSELGIVWPAISNNVIFFPKKKVLHLTGEERSQRYPVSPHPIERLMFPKSNRWLQGKVWCFLSG